MANQWEPFHQRGSEEVCVSRADGLVMVFARAVSPIAAATITDALKHMYKQNPTLADNLINVSLEDKDRIEIVQKEERKYA